MIKKTLFISSFFIISCVYAKPSEAVISDKDEEVGLTDCDYHLFQASHKCISSGVSSSSSQLEDCITKKMSQAGCEVLVVDEKEVDVMDVSCRPSDKK